MTITAKDISQLRRQTGAGIMDCRSALEQAKGDMAKAKTIIAAKGLARAANKKDRQTSAGIVHSYVHSGAQVGAMVRLTCETDFVARTKDFTSLAHELCMQIASMKPKSVSQLLAQTYIRDSAKTVQALIDETIAKVGENIQVVDIYRTEI